jgi:prolycopene isomerase
MAFVLPPPSACRAPDGGSVHFSPTASTALLARRPPRQLRSVPSCKRRLRPTAAVAVPAPPDSPSGTPASVETFDAVVVGSGIGALTAAADLASKGASVVVLERYLIPGGSSGYFEREGYRFDVGASMIFGFGDKGTTNLLTRALAAVGRELETAPDPVQVRYHLPGGIDVRTHREYERFIEDLTARFPHEANGIRHFYDSCWTVFNSLNAMPLKSLEEPAYLLQVFLAHPIACLNLVRYIWRNAGDVARERISDPELLKFIDMECYSWSVAPAALTPMINAGMVFSDRHYGGINYPVGGVGRIAEELAAGIKECAGCDVRYRARVTKVIFGDVGEAVGVELADGSTIRARAVVSNSTRWDTFGGLVPEDRVPRDEKLFRERYVKSPSFFSMHIGVREDALQVDMSEAAGMDCHHIMLDDWDDMEAADGARGTLFLSIPTVLDKSLAPPGRHIFHVFTPSWMDEWRGLTSAAYEAKKASHAATLVARLEATLFPGLSDGIEFMEAGTSRTHRRFLGRVDGSYGPVASKRLPGLLTMPFNRTAVDNLYCVGDSTFPGQGLNAVAFSGFACGHRIAADLGLESKLPGPIDKALTGLLSRARLRIGA